MKKNILDRTIDTWNNRMVKLNKGNTYEPDPEKILSINYSQYSYESSNIVFRTKDQNELLAALMRSRLISDVIVTIDTSNHTIFRKTFPIETLHSSDLSLQFREGLLEVVSELMLAGINEYFNQLTERIKKN